MKVGILGGGLTGLAVAAHLQCDYEVLEKEDRCGGHCRSVVEEGFTFDAGGPHIMFSRDKETLDYMVSLLGDNVHQGLRNNKIYFKGRYVKYPFENGLYDLDPQDRFECLYYYLRNDYSKPTNFKEWIYYTFGKGLAEKYLVPYNEKIWNVPAEEMAFDWVEGRVPKPPLEDVIKSAVGVETEGYTHQLHFYYPCQGGIEELPRALERRCRNVSTGFAVRQTWQENGQWLVSDGREMRQYDKLVSTIPIQDLIAALPDVPDEVAQAVNALRYNSLIVTMLGLGTDSLPDYTAVYSPDTATKFHRISFPQVFSPENAPSGYSAVAAEITTNPGDGTWEMNDDEIVVHVIDGLADMGLLRPEQVVYRKVVRAKYAYVVQDFGYRPNLEVAKGYVDGLGIISAGRVAEFKYINMDEAVHQGLAKARQLNGDKK